MTRRMVRRLTADPAREVPDVEVRWGIIDSVGSGTVDVRLSTDGQPLEGIRHLASYTPNADDTVLMLKSGTELVVLGDLA